MREVKVTPVGNLHDRVAPSQLVQLVLDVVHWLLPDATAPLLPCALVG